MESGSDKPRDGAGGGSDGAQDRGTENRRHDQPGQDAASGSVGGSDRRDGGGSRRGGRDRRGGKRRGRRDRGGRSRRRSRSDRKSDVRPEREDQQGADAKPERDQQMRAEREVQPTPDARTEPDAQAGPDARTEPDAQAGPDAKVERDEQIGSDGKPEPDIQATPDARPEQDAQARRDAKAERDEQVGPEAQSEPAARGILRGTPESFEMEFKGGRKALFENPRNIPFRAGDHAIVEVDRGQDIGVIVREGSEASKKLRDKGIQGPILRRATAADTSHLDELREKEAEAHRICQQCIARQSLPMKLVDVEWQFDGNKIRFYFTSDRRVDFRKLVRDLASIFKTRIEMRQIGVRDEARRLGGFGRCGRYYCCRGVISDFDPVTLKMVKEQHLAPGSPKISGGCGRLMCCLRYERDLYSQAKKTFPKIGSKGTIEGETFKVIGTDIFRRTVTLARKDDDPITVTLDDFKNGKITAVGAKDDDVQEDYWGDMMSSVADDE